MAKATKITIEFDDGTTHDVDPGKAGSIYTSESKAKESGKKEPWKKSAATTMAGECYIINGVIVCV